MSDRLPILFRHFTLSLVAMLPLAGCDVSVTSSSAPTQPTISTTPATPVAPTESVETVSPDIAEPSPAESLVAAPASEAGTWPSFRGPTHMGATSEDAPVSWSEEENIVWKTPLGGGGSSTPIVYDDRIYLTTFTGYLVPGEDRGSLDNLERHLLCLDFASGKELWRKTVKAKLPEEERIRDHGYAANSVAVDAERIYVFFGKSGVHAYSHAGDLLWSADVGSRTHGWGTAASPVLYKNLVFINASVESESLVALEAASGKEVWRANGIKEAWNTPLIAQAPDGKDELVLAIHGKVLGFEPLTGKPLWNCDTDITWYMVPSPVAANGVVYYLGGRSGTAALAVRLGGEGDVTSTHRLWTSKTGSNVTSPVIKEGKLYWMSEKLGIAYCADAATGKLLYEERINRAGQVYASTVLAGDRLYYVSRGGTTYVIAATPEYQLLSTNPLRDGTQFDASPAVVDGKLLVRSNKYLYCIGE